jgi:NAD(P)-dependent dehydrogenase (short-subunit alcohol dehydrogenase family)
VKSVAELMNLRGRVALITGGAGHIGQAVGEALGELKAKLVVLDVDAERCIDVARTIEQHFDTEVMALALDLTDADEVSSAPEKILDKFGRLDIVINCAALVASSDIKGWSVPFAEQQVEAWKLGLDVNLTAPFALIQACSEALRESGNGSVINISSIYGMVGPDMRLYEDTALGNVAAYAASKGGLLQLTRWLSTVLTPDVRVNAISIGGVWRGQPEKFHRRYSERTPLGRMATEEDLKGAVAYLASDLSAYVTGHNLVVDGGWTAW